MKKVLFVCIHNSARSQMAEAYLNLLGQGEYFAESAGIEPGKLNPFVVKVMAQDGIDISENKTQSVQSVVHKEYDLVVTVCDQASSQRCPVFPIKTQRLHWGFPDPSSFSGPDDQKLELTREVRDSIKKKIAEFVKDERG